MAAAVVALGVAACFDDPTSSLRNGPTAIKLTKAALTVRAEDSSEVLATLVDDQGNPLPTEGITWTSADDAVAVVNVDTRVIPGEIFSRAFIRGTAAAGGVTTVTVAVGSITNSFRVLVTPRYLTGAAAVGGTPKPDTVVVPQAPGVPNLLVPFTAGDTLTITAPAGLTFDTVLSVVRFGLNAGYFISKSPTEFKVLPRAAFAGRVTVTRITQAGNAETGPVRLDSLFTDSILIARPRTGTASVAGDTLTAVAPAGATFSTTTSGLRLVTGGTAIVISRAAGQIRAIAPYLATSPVLSGFTVTNLTVNGRAVDSLTYNGRVPLARPTYPNGSVSVVGDTVVVAAPAGVTFTTATTNQSTIKIGSAAGIIIQRTATLMRALSNNNYSGAITVINPVIGVGRADSLKTSASFTVAKASFGGTVNAGAGRLLDTVKVYGNALNKFTTTGANVSQVTLGGRTASVIVRTADSMYVMALVPNSGPATITNVLVGPAGSQITLPSLNTAGNVVIGPATGEANEPANNSRTTATAIGFTGATDTIDIRASLDCEDDGTACPGNGDIQDYYLLTLPASAKIKAILEWFGDGSGGPSYTDTNNPDLDVLICVSGVACGYGNDVLGNAAAHLVQPETGTTAAAQAAGTYTVRVLAWLTPAPIQYRLRLIRQ